MIEREFRTSWVHQGYLEPQSCSAMFDPLGNLTVYASTQALFHTRSQVGHVLGLADHQVGTAINPATVEGQMEGAAIQAVGWGLFEQIAWDEQGTPTTASLMDYAIPKASQAPPLGTVLVNVPSEQGPYGAKGVGEPPVIPGAAALANAVYQAVGARVRELPMTSERVLGAMLATRNGSPNGTSAGHLVNGLTGPSTVSAVGRRFARLRSG